MVRRHRNRKSEPLGKRQTDTLIRSGYPNLPEVNRNRSPEPISESCFRKSLEIRRIRSFPAVRLRPGNMFYMKTCSFCYARPRTLNEGLFCIGEPEARYELAACGNCALCYPKYDRTYRSRKSIVEFSQAHRHIFVNGYQSILNCSPVSSTNPFCLSLPYVNYSTRDVFCSPIVSFVVMPYTKHHLCLNMSMWKR